MGGFARLYGVVAAVVRARGALVYQNITAFCKEHLNRHYSAQIPEFRNTDGKFFRLFERARVNPANRTGDILHKVRPVIEHHFNRREALGLVIRISRNDDRNLLLYVNKLLNYGFAFKKPVKVGVRADNKHPAPVITAPAQFMNKGTT